MNKDLINEMVNRFLGWRLPDDFNPDGGISFEARAGREPVGTNLFTASQAREMVLHMLEGSEPLLRTHCRDCGVSLEEVGAETLRDRLAMAALTGILAGGNGGGDAAFFAYQYADAMLRARR